MSTSYKHEQRKYHPIEEKVVVITGASSGIGAEIATHFAEIGYKKLVLVSIFIVFFWQVSMNEYYRFLGGRID